MTKSLRPQCVWKEECAYAPQRQAHMETSLDNDAAPQVPMLTAEELSAHASGDWQKRDADLEGAH